MSWIRVADEIKVLSFEVEWLYLDKIVNWGIQVTAFGFCSLIHI